MFNLSLEGSTSSPDPRKYQYYLLLAILNVLVATSAVVSNLVLAAAIFRIPDRNRQRFSPFSLLVMNLSICDLLAAVVIGFGYSYYNILLLTGGARQDFFIFGIVVNHVGVVTNIVSVCTISALSVERFYAISFPLRHKVRFRKKTVKAFLVACWLYAVLFTCLSPAFSYSFFILLYIHVHGTVPLICLPLVYWKTYSALRSHNIQVGHLPTVQRQPRELIHRNRERKLVSAILLILVMFYITFMPSYIAINMSALRPSFFKSQSFSLFYGLSYVILLLNCIFNPFIYSWRIPQYRRAFKAVFGGCDCCSRQIETSIEQGVTMELRRRHPQPE